MAKREDLKSLVTGVLEADEKAEALEVERQVEDMAPAPVTGTVLKLPLNNIQPDPDQPRRTFSQEGLEELAASIQEQGVLEPIQVIALDEGYQLLHGERRWRAARIADLSWIPAIIYEEPLTDADRLVRQLIENIQREDLNDVDRAAALERLKGLMDATWEDVAERVGLTVGRIHQIRRLQKLAPDLQEAVRAGELTEKDSRPYQGLSQEEQLSLHRARQEEELPSDVVTKVAQRLKERADESVSQAIREIELEQERAEARRQPLEQERTEARRRQPAPDMPPTLSDETTKPEGAPDALPAPEPEALPGWPDSEAGPEDDAAERPQTVKPIPPPEVEPYDDVGTERLLSYLDRVAEDAGNVLFVVQALRRRPLASWEEQQIEDALAQLQEAVAQLEDVDDEDDDEA